MRQDKRVRDRRCNFLLTMNNPTEKEIEVVRNNENDHEMIVGQLEVGESGTEHIQFCIGYKNPVEFSTVKNLYPEAHIEEVKRAKLAVAYCCKLKTRKEFLVIIGYKYKVIKSEDIKTLYDWQKKIIEVINEIPDKRKIYWLWEDVGNSGKTTFSKYLYDRYPVIYLSSGKGNDILYNFSIQYDTLEEDEKTTVIFDFTRSTEDYISYSSIENIKNGIMCINKYESKVLRFNTPHIIVFANFEPDRSKLSQDRWKIIMIGPNPLVQKT